MHLCDDGKQVRSTYVGWILIDMPGRPTQKLVRLFSMQTERTWSPGEFKGVSEMGNAAGRSGLGSHDQDMRVGQGPDGSS